MPEIKSAEIKSAEIKSPEIKSPETKSAETETPNPTSPPTHAWTPEGIVTIEAKPAPGEQFSFFEDDEGDQLYSGTVFLGGAKVRVRELTKEEATKYRKGELRLAEAIQSLANADGHLGGSPGGSLDGKSADSAIANIERLQIENWDYVIGLAVTGWELKRPGGQRVECTPEAKRKLRRSQKSELSDKIVQRSSMGRDLSGFFRRVLESYAGNKPLRFPPQFREVEDWFEEWLLGLIPTDRAKTPARKWDAMVMWSGAWKRLPLDIERGKMGRRG